MPSPAAHAIECEQIHPSLSVPDVRSAADFYVDKLGFGLAFLSGDPPTMAGVTLGNVQLFLEQGTPSPTGCSVYFVVGDVDTLFERHRANGIDVVRPLTDQTYGLRDYFIHDLHGYPLGFGQQLFNAGPPLVIEREDVPVRLEKRLAALLRDLATHKRMSVSSCLEETLLHTLEGVGPHTKGGLVYIQELKARHGIDYDSHASYRFVER